MMAEHTDTDELVSSTRDADEETLDWGERK